jgi:hypothetical protein
MHVILGILFILLQPCLPSLHAAPPLARGLLHADGLVRVLGADPARTRITILPADGEIYILDQGTRRFVLELKLNNTYLVSFEHPLCITKQLFFDTRVPDQYMLDEYAFPFEVELVADRTEGGMRYAGPVGYISYQEDLNDFDHVTDYSLEIDRRIRERMELLSTPPAHDVPIQLPLSISVPDAPPLEVEEAEMAETLPMEPRPVVIEPAPVPEPEPEERPMVEPPPVSAPPEEEAAPEDQPLPADPAPDLPPPAVSSPVRAAEVPLNAEIREEELIVDDKRVTTIVRLTDSQGHSHEYRRVAHKFGAVYYFMDDQSIPEHMYRTHTGK